VFIHSNHIRNTAADRQTHCPTSVPWPYVKYKHQYRCTYHNNRCAIWCHRTASVNTSASERSQPLQNKSIFYKNMTSMRLCSGFRQVQIIPVWASAVPQHGIHHQDALQPPCKFQSITSKLRDYRVLKLGTVKRSTLSLDKTANIDSHALSKLLNNYPEQTTTLSNACRPCSVI